MTDSCSSPRSEFERLIVLEKELEMLRQTQFEETWELRQMIDLLAEKLGVEVKAGPSLVTKEPTEKG